MGPTTISHLSQFSPPSFSSMDPSTPSPFSFTADPMLPSAVTSEYLSELVLFPELKEHRWIRGIGVSMVLLGEIIRKAAIVTARRSFTHIIRVHYDQDHHLITHGIYRYMRHPSYFGFFIWAIGTQVMLCNPLCTLHLLQSPGDSSLVAYQYEEFFLRQFFGPQYIEYARRVPSGLPFIK